MKKNKKRFSLKTLWETQTTKELLETYDGLIGAIEECKAREKESKGFEKEAASLEKFLKERLNKLPDYEIEALYNETTDYDGQALLLLRAYARKCPLTEKLIWAYNENVNAEEEVDRILEKKLRKYAETIVHWHDIVDDAPKGSRISYHGINQMIPLVKSLSDLLFTLQLNKESLTNSKIKEENHELLMQKVETVKVSKRESKEFKKEIAWEETSSGKKLKLLCWK